MKTAEIVKIKIEKLDDDLCGVAFRGGKKYVVAKTLPDEEVLCEVKRKSGNPAERQFLQICRYVAETPVTGALRRFSTVGNCGN